MTTYAGRPVFPPYFTDPTGNPQELVSVTIYNRGTTVKPTLYTSRTKATPLPNPFNADSLGNAEFYVDPGEYDALVNGVTLPFSAVPDPTETGESPDATTVVKGKVQLAGDLAGTAAAPTVPALATKVDMSSAQTLTGRKKFLGADRGDGTFYLTEIGGTFPSIATNTSVVINGATGDPVPPTIAGEATFMLGVSSDVGAAPAIVAKGQSGPLWRGYNAGDVKTSELSAAGTLELVGGLGSSPNFLPSYSFIGDTDTGMDRAGANILRFVAGGVEHARVDVNGMTVTGDFITTQKIQTGNSGIDINFKWLLYSPDGNVYMRDQTNARMHMTWFQGVSNTNAETQLHSSLRVDGNVGFYGTGPVAKQTGVAVTAAAIHAALVTLGLIAA